MVVIKNTSSGKAVQVILDDGSIYQISKFLLLRFLNNQLNGDFVVLTRMPVGTTPGRFPPSPGYGDVKLDRAVGNAGNDGLSKAFTTERENQKIVDKVEDFKVSW